MVEIFKTDVCCEQRAKEIISFLKGEFPEYALNFDLEDDDRILRAESNQVDVNKILLTLESRAIRAAVLH